jgi:Ser/Thr protein kinase RdoA (MazF antagonist)
MKKKNWRFNFLFSNPLFVLHHVHDVDLDKVAEEAITRFSNRGMHSLSHYRIIENKVRNYAT